MARDPHAETKLRGLLVMLFDFRHELEAAEIRGDALSAETVRNLIRTQHGIIRHHCAAMGLPRPSDVPSRIRSGLAYASSG